MPSTLPAAPNGDNPFKTLWDLGYQRLVPIIPPGAEVNGDTKLAEIFRDMLVGNARGAYPYTPPWPLFSGLRASVTMLLDEGLEAVFARLA